MSGPLRARGGRAVRRRRRSGRRRVKFRGWRNVRAIRSRPAPSPSGGSGPGPALNDSSVADPPRDLHRNDGGGRHKIPNLRSRQNLCSGPPGGAPAASGHVRLCYSLSGTRRCAVEGEVTSLFRQKREVVRPCIDWRERRVGDDRVRPAAFLYGSGAAPFVERGEWGMSGLVGMADRADRRSRRSADDAGGPPRCATICCGPDSCAELVTGCRGKAVGERKGADIPLSPPAARGLHPLVGGEVSGGGAGARVRGSLGMRLIQHHPLTLALWACRVP